MNEFECGTISIGSSAPGTALKGSIVDAIIRVIIGSGSTVTVVDSIDAIAQSIVEMHRVVSAKPDIVDQGLDVRERAVVVEDEDRQESQPGQRANIRDRGPVEADAATAPDCGTSD